MNEHRLEITGARTFAVRDGWASMTRAAVAPALTLSIAWIGLTVLLGAFDVWSLTAGGVRKDAFEFAIGGCLIATGIGLMSSLACRLGPWTAHAAPAATSPTPER